MVLGIARSADFVTEETCFRGGEPMRRRKNPRLPGLKRDEVCQQIREMILRGQRRPGAKLRQLELAERFGVSEGSVREALLELKRQGLVESIERRGMFVARLDRERLAEALEIREMHESLAVRRCCERVTRSEVRALVDLAEQVYRRAAAGEAQESAALDRLLHGRLIDLSGQGMLSRLADNYRPLVESLRDERDPQVVRREHLAILRAIEDGKADDAERLVRGHVAAVRV
jgi:DNA-binding GntR family transcriptional regulator